MMPLPPQRRHRVNGCSHSDTRYASHAGRRQPGHGQPERDMAEGVRRGGVPAGSLRQRQAVVRCDFRGDHRQDLFAVSGRVGYHPGSRVPPVAHNESGYGHLSWPYPRHAGQRGHGRAGAGPQLPAASVRARSLRAAGREREPAGQPQAARHRLPGTSWPWRPVPGPPAAAAHGPRDGRLAGRLLIAGSGRRRKGGGAGSHGLHMARCGSSAPPPGFIRPGPRGRPRRWPLPGRGRRIVPGRRRTGRGCAP